MLPPLISVKELQAILNDKDLIILDASQQAVEEIIPGARLFDIKNKFSDINSNYPNSFPSTKQFEIESQQLGINNKSKLVVYDNKGIYSSPRVWYMFRAIGHKNITVLDGGLPAWKSENLRTNQHSKSKYKKGNFTANKSYNNTIGYQEICKNIVSKDFQLVDARSTGRFNGTTPEPRKGIKSGHIPNSINIPYLTLLKNNHFKTKGELKEIFKSLTNINKPIVFSCGSGITACILLLGYYIAYNLEANLYDGSWTEWAIKQQLFNE